MHGDDGSVRIIRFGRGENAVKQVESANLFLMFCAILLRQLRVVTRQTQTPVASPAFLQFAQLR